MLLGFYPIWSFTFPSNTSSSTPFQFKPHCISRCDGIMVFDLGYIEERLELLVPDDKYSCPYDLNQDTRILTSALIIVVCIRYCDCTFSSHFYNLPNHPYSAFALAASLAFFLSTLLLISICIHSTTFIPAHSLHPPNRPTAKSAIACVQNGVISCILP